MSEIERPAETHSESRLTTEHPPSNSSPSGLPKAQRGSIGTGGNTPQEPGVENGPLTSPISEPPDGGD